MKTKIIFFSVCISSIINCLGQCPSSLTDACNPLWDRDIVIKSGCHYSDCSQFECNYTPFTECVDIPSMQFNMAPRKQLFRSAKFKANFQSCDYFYDRSKRDWNKVMKIAISNLPDTYLSNRLGWRWDDNLQKIEIGLYTHINHQGNNLGERGREFLSLGKFYSLETTTPMIELILGHHGMYLYNDGKSIAIRRRIFPELYCYGSLITKNAYFEVQTDESHPEEPAPHNMKIEVSDIISDCPTNLNNSYWNFFGTYKGFANSVFYYNESDYFFAPLMIEASLPIDAPSQSQQTPYPSPFTVLEYGSDITFTSCQKIVLNPGFVADFGSHFVAQIISCRTTDNGDSIPSQEFFKYSNKPIDDNEFLNEIQSLASFSLSPNPSAGSFTANFSENLIGKSLQIFSVLGTKVFQTQILSEESSINLPELQAGVYFCVVGLQGTNKIEGLKTQKLVILK